MHNNNWDLGRCLTILFESIVKRFKQRQTGKDKVSNQVSNLLTEYVADRQRLKNSKKRNNDETNANDLQHQPIKY